MASDEGEALMASEPGAAEVLASLRKINRRFDLLKAAQENGGTHCRIKTIRLKVGISA